MVRKRREKLDFGKYIVKLIKDAGMSQFDFYTETEIAKPYFYDILSGRVNPLPWEALERMMNVLEKRLPPDEKRHTEFINHAAISRGEIPCDISEMILRHPDCWDSICTTLQTMLASSK